MFVTTQREVYPGLINYDVFVLADSNKNAFKSFKDLFEILTFTHVLTSLLESCDLVLYNIAQVSQYTVVAVFIGLRTEKYDQIMRC